MTVQPRAVPCDGCTACCESDLIFLHPEEGDDPAQYNVVPEMNPLTGALGWRLATRENGNCIYLGAGGCMIHGRAPATCRGFDCRMLFAGMDRPSRRMALKRGFVARRVIEAGRIRLDTLSPEDRARAEARRKDRPDHLR